MLVQRLGVVALVMRFVGRSLVGTERLILGARWLTVRPLLVRVYFTVTRLIRGLSAVCALISTGCVFDGYLTVRGIVRWIAP